MLVVGRERRSRWDEVSVWFDAQRDRGDTGGVDPTSHVREYLGMGIIIDLAPIDWLPQI